MKRPLLLASVLMTLALPARADENLLGYTMGAETLPQGAAEAYLWLTDHRGKRQGHYESQHLRLEYEYGVTDSLSASVYLNGYRHDYNGSPAPGEVDGALQQSRLSGASVEVKKMLASPYKDGLGVALYGEVTHDSIDSVTGEKVDAWELEGKLIFQKPFLDDQLQWVTNLELEAETTRPRAGGEREHAIAPRLRTGVSYRFAPNWFVGFEGWGDVEYSRKPGEAWKRAHWDVFAGPSLHYGARQWWATLTYVKQLAGSDERDMSTGLHLADHEKQEIRLKLGYNF
ncbi:MAG: DUF6662 family protein [Burkholderiales bacterium]